MFNLEELGEKTINKIAEMALASQIEQADNVSVQVKTDPEKLAKGILESITLDGRGVRLNPYLRSQQMKIVLNKIIVHPFKALMGNIQLIEPSQGTVSIVVSEKNLEQSLRTRNWSKILAPLMIQQIRCQINEQGQISVNLQLESKTREVQSVYFRANAVMVQGKVLVQIQPTEDNSIHEILLKEISQAFNFDSFRIEGLNFRLHELSAQEGQFLLQGIAVMSKFPKS